MFSFEDLIFIQKNSEPIDLEDNNSFQISSGLDAEIENTSMQEIITSIKSLVADESSKYEIISCDLYPDKIIHYKLDNPVTIWQNSKIDLIMIGSLPHDTTWVYFAISSLLNTGTKITHQSLLNIRYSLLRIPSLRINHVADEFDELFFTIPETHFQSSFGVNQTRNILELLDKPTPDSIDETIAHLDNLFKFLSKSKNEQNVLIISKIFSIALELSNRYVENQREILLIKLNIIPALFLGYVPEKINPKIIELIYSIKFEAEKFNLKNIIWICEVLLVWHFNFDYEIEKTDWDSYDIPKRLTLIPHLIFEEKDGITTFDGELSNYLELNIKVLSEQVYFFGLEILQEKLAKLYFDANDYNSSSTFYGYAAELEKDLEKTKEFHQMSLQADMMHYKELAIASNLFAYSGRLHEAVNMAWSALSGSMQIIKQSLEHKLPCHEFIPTILEYYSHCKRPLLVDKNEMTQVIELKLEELQNFYVSLSLQEMEEDMAKQMVEMHQDSLRFMMPQKPPLFLLMTVDGRLIYSMEAIADPSDIENSTINHLIAGALTAIRSILTEASLSQSGAVKEISIGDSTLLIEARTGAVLVVSAMTVDDNLRRFSAELSDEIEENWGEVLYKWFGDSESVTPIIEHIKERVLNEIVQI